MSTRYITFYSINLKVFNLKQFLALLVYIGRYRMPACLTCQVKPYFIPYSYSNDWYQHVVKPFNALRCLQLITHFCYVCNVRHCKIRL